MPDFYIIFGGLLSTIFSCLVLYNWLEKYRNRTHGKKSDNFLLKYWKTLTKPPGKKILIIGILVIFTQLLFTSYQAYKVTTKNEALETSINQLQEKLKTITKTKAPELNILEKRVPFIQKQQKWLLSPIIKNYGERTAYKIKFELQTIEYSNRFKKLNHKKLEADLFDKNFTLQADSKLSLKESFVLSMNKQIEKTSSPKYLYIKLKWEDKATEQLDSTINILEWTGKN